MKKLAHSSLWAAVAVAGLILGSSPASAHEEATMVSMSQSRLNDLGYFAGHEDGFIGPQTRSALRDFQTYNGLAVTEILDGRTYDLLLAQDYALHNGGLVNGRPVTIRYVTTVQYAQPTSTAYTNTMCGARNAAVPTATPVSSYGSNDRFHSSPVVWHY